MKRPKGLGRGLDALLAGNDEAAPPAKDTTGTLRVEQLEPGKYQPRTRMDETALAELADSIRAQGLMQPILVRSVGAERFEIIAGERRWRASQLAGLAEVPVLIRDVPDENAAAMALIENIQREDLNALEEAQGVQRLINEFGLTHEQAAGAIGRSRSATSNLLRLLNLAKPVQTMLLAGDLDMGHARALLAVDAATQITLANQIAARRLSVREAEKLVAKVGAEFTLKASQAPKKKAEDRDTLRLAEQLSEALGTSVTIKPGKKGAGSLVIDYHSLEALQGVVERLLPDEGR
ncbi:ParB/RepB/Spo0J family partition protein [Piscinibacterium candidicorallinum]|uniref:ParB/RepB/Spo0J family partition protein n=1 Tax=Piscinibacterium candidicorallinum TaxID=1793872 RepID=A0ABV7H779_9BURK